MRSIATELQKFSAELAALPRWLVLNKIDLLAPDQRDTHCRAIVEALDWNGPVFGISAATGEGTQALLYAVHEYLGKL